MGDRGDLENMRRARDPTPGEELLARLIAVWLIVSFLLAIFGD